MQSGHFNHWSSRYRSKSEQPMASMLRTKLLSSPFLREVVLAASGNDVVSSMRSSSRRCPRLATYRRQLLVKKGECDYADCHQPHQKLSHSTRDCQMAPMGFSETVPETVDRQTRCRALVAMETNLRAGQCRNWAYTLSVGSARYGEHANAGGHS